jgi:WD40 repeat protein
MIKLILTILLITNFTRFYGQINSDIKPFKILKGHPYKIMYLDFSSDGKYLASCGWDNTIRIWDMNNFSEKEVLMGHSDVVWTSVISNDNRFLASGSQDGSFILWDFKFGELRKKVNIPGKANMYFKYADPQKIEMPNSVYGIAFSNDNRLLSVGCADGNIRIYNTDSLRLMHTLKGHQTMPITILFDSKDELIVSSAIGSEIIVWDAKTYEPLQIIKGETAYTCQFINDEKYLLSAGGCMVEIYSTSNWERVRSFPAQCGIQSAQVFANGKYLATCGEDHTARLYNFETGKEIWCYTNPKPEVGFCSVSPNEKYFAVGIPEGDILVWQLNELLRMNK